MNLGFVVLYVRDHRRTVTNNRRKAGCGPDSLWAAAWGLNESGLLALLLISSYDLGGGAKDEAALICR